MVSFFWDASFLFRVFGFALTGDPFSNLTDYLLILSKPALYNENRGFPQILREFVEKERAKEDDYALIGCGR